MSKKNILIYGATGSIGDSTLNLIRNNKKLFNVVGLTCNNNVGKLINIANEFECKNLGIYDESQVSKYSELKNFNIYFGLSNFHKLVTVNVDIIIFAISGSSPFHLLFSLSYLLLFL